MTPATEAAARLELVESGLDVAATPFDPDHEALAETATDPLELAALLESGGLTDRRVREAYGFENVFAYARELFGGTTRRTVVAVREETQWTFSPARSTARLAPILTILFLQAILGDHLANLSRGELAAALVVPMLGSAVVLAPAGYLGGRYVVCGYTRPGAAAAIRLLWIGTALLALAVIAGTIAGSAAGVLEPAWSFATVGLVSAALWALVSLLLTLEKEFHVHGAVLVALAVGLLVAAFTDVTAGTAAGAVAFAAFGTFAVALALHRSPPMSTRVPPLRRQARSLFPAAFYGVLGPVIVLADWPAAHILGLDRSQYLALTTGATFAVIAAVLLYETQLTRLQSAASRMLGATDIGTDGLLADWASRELGRRRGRAVWSVVALVASVAGASALLAAVGIGTPFAAGFFTACFAAYAAVGVLHGELLVLVWLGRPGRAVAIQAAVAGLALGVSFPGTFLVGVWVAPLVFLTVCPLGVALTRRVAAQAVAEGGYSFYRAAF
jgi:hypothetical protein